MSSDVDAGTRLPYSPYVYRPLLAGTTEIRILELLPGPFEAPLAARIVHTSLGSEIAQIQSQAPYYEALSYVWGDPRPLHDVTIKPNSRLSIGENLYAALRRIRLQDRSRYVSSS